MKVHALRGENMMRMKLFDISLDEKGNTIIISGKNGEGKSSLINSMVLALGGSKSDVARLTTKTVRYGEKKAWVEVELDDYTVRRTWIAGGKESLSVIGSKGEKFSSPQKMLDQILGDLSFDPLEFTRMKMKDQKELLLSIVDIEIDLDEHEAKRAEVFAKRTDIGRERDRLQGAVESLPDFPSNTPDEEVVVADLLKQNQEQTDNNYDFDKGVSVLRDATAEVEKLEDALEIAKAKQTDAKDYMAGRVKKDLSVIQDEIDNAELVNKNIRIKKDQKKLTAEYKEQADKYDSGTAFIKKLDQEKLDALDKAEMPVEGLSLVGDEVTFRDIPFGQLSSSEQIKVSTAIGMSQNPDLRVMIVKDGSLLDKDNLKALGVMAQAHDFQVFVEMVDDSGEMGFVIEDGEVVSDSSKE